MGGESNDVDLQKAVSQYLAAEFAHSVGAYDCALGLLDDTSASADTTLGTTLRALTRNARRFNRRLALERWAASEAPQLREPSPPAPATIGAAMTRSRRWNEAQGVCLDYYATVNASLAEGRLAGAALEIRRAILLDVHDDATRVSALQARFLKRNEFLRQHLQIAADSTPTPRPEYFWNAHIAAGPASQVLDLAAEAHALSHHVVHERSGCVGSIMERVADGQFEEDRKLLQRAKALYTFAFSIPLAMPWIFAADSAEREAVVLGGLGAARRTVAPFATMWVARQIMLITLYRRAGVWALLGEHARSYNDYWKTQQIVRLTRAGAARLPPDALASLNVLDALAEYKIGELFRADHDYRQALVHCCRSHDRLLALPSDASPGATSPVGTLLANSYWRVSLLLTKGKAFYEQGQMKRACKWYLRAWQAMGDIAATSTKVTKRRLPNILTPEMTAQIESVTAWLTEIRHDPDFVKTVLLDKIAPVVAKIGPEYIPKHLRALAADILDRLGHTLMILRLPDNDALAERCLMVAASLDPSNLLVRSDLLQLLSRGRQISDPEQLPPVLACWPSGGTVVDQVIRVAEHHTRRHLRDCVPLVDEGAVPQDSRLVARALLTDFLTHTDSIHVRSGLFYQLLAPHREGQVLAPPKPAMEFVCLRRYGSSSPFLARPASVPAIGGGYLIRLLGTTRQYNILVDPGEGVVANLYRVGFAITDIDMIIITHDHPDHLAGLDPILALLKEAGKLLAGRSQPEIYGNASVVQRYAEVAFTRGRGIRLLPACGESLTFAVPTGGSVRIETLPTAHVDLGGHQAAGFRLVFSAIDGEAVGSLVFMSDSRRSALADPRLQRVIATDDVIVAHISNASVQELGSITFPNGVESVEASVFERELASFGRSKSPFAKAEHKKLAHALGRGGPEESQHLLLRGVLDVARTMAGGVSERPDSARVLVVGEFREQLGPFRGKIARHITDHILKDAGHVCLTADIGLRLRIDVDGVQTLCSRCTLNNDRLPLEQYHDPREIREVCVKGDFEGMKWNCARHDPGSSQGSVGARFVERTASYDVFGPGGLFHG
ncbi:MAG: hypothetical protein QOH12_1112 [Solirubrobacteraceae bacterium]|nr:hypothetical protein [Solirubrobacteraceae bacterium]